MTETIHAPELKMLKMLKMIHDPMETTHAPELPAHVSATHVWLSVCAGPLFQVGYEVNLADGEKDPVNVTIYESDVAIEVRDTRTGPSVLPWWCRCMTAVATITD